MRQAILALSLFLLVCPVAYADSVDRYIEAQMRKRHIPGLSLAVVVDGKIVKAKG
jgi:CubicO group peptidase (beta-lactamase class C family)